MTAAVSAVATAPNSARRMVVGIEVRLGPGPAGTIRRDEALEGVPKCSQSILYVQRESLYTFSIDF